MWRAKRTLSQVLGWDSRPRTDRESHVNFFLNKWPEKSKEHTWKWRDVENINQTFEVGPENCVHTSPRVSLDFPLCLKLKIFLTNSLQFG